MNHIARAHLVFHLYSSARGKRSGAGSSGITDALVRSTCLAKEAGFLKYTEYITPTLTKPSVKEMGTVGSMNKKGKARTHYKCLFCRLDGNRNDK